ncbi:MAG TPA: type IV secretory system conjugative DNA transfer family protein [Devosiaceae bacterium]|jgi:type IV secretion system protein VirD4|nr:type IV secretory system conjugative DNA transfer family protein [Devosiaceae bacterium]
MRQTAFPPRGSGIEGRAESPPAEQWVQPWQLGPAWDWQPGRVLLGQWQGREFGIDDDRHIVTIAGSRSGKSSTVLKPNLARYPGSVVVLDPKGELAKATAEIRRAMGQQVFVLDPFGETGMESASHNPFEELLAARPEHRSADAALFADALIISHEKDPHWTDSAKNFDKGATLYLLATVSPCPTLRHLRMLMNSTPAELDELFVAMANCDAFDGVVSNIGAAFLGKKEAGGKELSSIMSTAQEQTAPLDDLFAVTSRSDFQLTDLRDGNTTIYLVLPGLRMGTHFRWLRLFIQQALAAMERAPVPRGQLPVWFVLEEFSSLGYMRTIESAAGLIAGAGVKLWPVLQDLTQLKTHYPNSWETFLGNAGIIQAFGNADLTTTEHLSKLLGTTQVVERQVVRVSGAAMAHGDTGQREHLRSVRLLDPNEITRHFARETGRQLILMPGRPPIYMERMDHHD